MMYYRRKILLALFQAAGGRLSGLRLNKLLFLLFQGREEQHYHFVPYKRGCFSFQAYADLGTLGKYGRVNKVAESTWEITDTTKYLTSLKESDRQALLKIVDKFGSYSEEELLHYTYLHFPYFAIRSEIINQVLTREEQKKVEAERPFSDETRLYTIGYEGLSLEKYLNKLLAKDVKVLCDVRRNPMSMKYGFSKSQLDNACKGVGIEYRHFPEVGIESSQRQSLDTKSDYDALFATYRETTLTKTLPTQSSLVDLVCSKMRVALTCFEADPQFCHRSHLADAMTQASGWQPALTHLA